MIPVIKRHNLVVWCNRMGLKASARLEQSLSLESAEICHAPNLELVGGSSVRSQLFIPLHHRNGGLRAKDPRKLIKSRGCPAV